MVADSNTQTDAVAEATKAQADVVAETTKTAAKAGEQTVKSAANASKKARRRTAKATRNTAKPARKAAPKSRRTAKRASAKPQSRANERNDQMKFDPTNAFAAFGAFPGATAFEKIFADSAERSEEAAKRSRKAVEELAQIYRGNIDAFVEASRIATANAQSISQNIAEKSRDNLDQAANNVRTLAEAKSATELLQLQSEFTRSAFDRFVEDSSALTESFVKMAGEAFQPISNRASANVERLNKIAA
jgi:phasin family protein